MKYRKKPVVIDARRFDDEDGETNASDLAAWCGGTIRTALAKPTDPASVTTYIDVRTLEGTMTAEPGDFIVRGVKGEFYPVKPDIFAATYEAEPETDQKETR